MGRFISRVGVALFLALASSATRGSAQSTPTPAHLSAAEFAGLAWLEGRWVGSGGGYDAFYEEYRFVNDSTLEQRTFPDSTFAEPDRRSLIEFKGGQVLKTRNGQVESMITRLSGDTIRFERARGGGGGFTWLRVAADHWRAVLGRPDQPVVYELRRAGG